MNNEEMGRLRDGDADDLNLISSVCEIFFMVHNFL